MPYLLQQITIITTTATNTTATMIEIHTGCLKQKTKLFNSPQPQPTQQPQHYNPPQVVRNRKNKLFNSPDLPKNVTLNVSRMLTGCISDMALCLFNRSSWDIYKEMVLPFLSSIAAVSAVGDSVVFSPVPAMDVVFSNCFCAGNNLIRCPTYVTRSID